MVKSRHIVLDSTSSSRLDSLPTVYLAMDKQVDTPSHLMKIHEIEYLNSDDEGRNKLHSALLKGDSDTVKEYLELGVNIKIKDQKYDRGCVSWAVKGDNLLCLRLLKKYMHSSDWKSSFYEPDKHKNLPIHLAALSHDNIELFKFVHQEGCYTLLEVGQKNFGLYHYVFTINNNQTIFQYINKNLNTAQKKYLISLRADDGTPPIGWYILKNRLDGVKAIINLPEFDINQPGFSYYTSPLIVACQTGNLELITLLLEHNADVAFCDLRNITPLMSAIKHQHDEVAALLLNHGANINQICLEGNTLLHLQIKHKEENIDGLIFLLNHGAATSILQEDIYGFRPIEWLSTDVDTYLSKLTNLESSIKNQLKNSYRKKAKKVNGRIIRQLLVKKYPAINEHTEGGICNAFGFLAAFSYFNNGLSLDIFYKDLEKVINDSGTCSTKMQSDYLERWANDIVWLQSDDGMKRTIFAKHQIKKDRYPRFYDFFSQRDRKKVLSFVTEKIIHGPGRPISYYFQAKYDGAAWVSAQLEFALKKRLSEESEFLEIISEHHGSVLLKKNNKFIFIDSNTENKITKSLNAKEVVSLLILKHYLTSKHSDDYYAGIFPFHIRSWSLCGPILQNEQEYEDELKQEMHDYLTKNKNIFDYFTPRQRHLLHFCAAMDDVISMKILLTINKNLDINISCQNDGYSPLYYAIGNNSFNCVKFLLQNNAIDIYCPNKNNGLMLMTAYQNEKMIELVLNCLAKRRIQPKDIVKGDFNFGFFVMAGGDKELIKQLFTKEECKQYLSYFKRSTTPT